jgi:hypothetical protein
MSCKKSYEVGRVIWRILDRMAQSRSNALYEVFERRKF